MFPTRMWFAALLAGRGATAEEADVITESALKEEYVQGRSAAEWFAWADERIAALREGRPLPFIPHITIPEPEPEPQPWWKRWWERW